MMLSSQDQEIVNLYGLLLDWRRPLPFQAVYEEQEDGGVYRCRVNVHPADGRWEVLKDGDEQVIRHDPSKEGPASSGISIPSQIFPNKSHRATDLAFPLTLPIWGREMDSFRAIGIEKSDDEAILLLRHQRSPETFGSLKVDLKRRVCTQLTSPYGIRRYSNFSFAHPL